MSDTHADMLKKFQTFLEQEEKSRAPGGTTTAARLAKMELWREMRQLLAVNDSSMASTVGALPHPDFEDVIIPAGPVTVPAAVPQKRASSGTPAKGSKSKKPRSSTGSAKSSKSDSGSSTETVSSTLDFELSPDTPAVEESGEEDATQKSADEDGDED
ncbi:hypothetical protein PF005_g15199 [Phytophthora fragariae]|uniref:Uncharacterized protein n=1 Tax=Phytophthora fragariae TaxID=53985 RepID=A0A6A3XKA1_9STRA|nr:hypothetical protein PF005_g15199 [Phytophthora fragariae]